jgi:hypothetical protein
VQDRQSSSGLPGFIFWLPGRYAGLYGSAQVRLGSGTGSADQKKRCSLSNIVTDRGRPTFMGNLQFGQVLDRVCVFIRVDDGMVCPAHQNEIVVAVPLGGCLLRVVSRSLRVCRLDVANLADNRFSLNDSFSALGEGTPVARTGK